MEKAEGIIRKRVQAVKIRGMEKRASGYKVRKTNEIG